MSVDRILKAIAKGRSFLISSHINLEGDALGSELALAYLLKKMGKECFVCNASPLPRIYNFLPFLKFIEPISGHKKAFDTAVIIDCSNLERLGKIKDLVTKDKVILNIDHHPDNDNFGKVNWVVPEVSATGELIYELFRRAGVKLNRNVALCLYVAILTDTGGFRYKNTTAQTHRIAGHLLENNISPEVVFGKIYEKHRLPRMKLLSLALAGMKTNKKGTVAWISVSQDMFRRTGTDTDDTEGFIEMGCSIENVEVAVFFQEAEPDKVKVGFRSKGDIDVGKIARSFGGGGHFAASGCILSGKLKEIEKRVIKELRFLVPC